MDEYEIKKKIYQKKKKNKKDKNFRFPLKMDPNS